MCQDDSEPVWVDTVGWDDAECEDDETFKDILRFIDKYNITKVSTVHQLPRLYDIQLKFTIFYRDTVTFQFSTQYENEYRNKRKFYECDQVHIFEKLKSCSCSFRFASFPNVTVQKSNNYQRLLGGGISKILA